MKQQLFTIKTIQDDGTQPTHYECGTREALVKSNKWLSGILPKNTDTSYFVATIQHDLTRVVITRL